MEYLDNMEGSELKTEAFSDSINPWNWFGSTTGSDRLVLDEVSAGNDPRHTRDGNPSLILDY